MSASEPNCVLDENVFEREAAERGGAFVTGALGAPGKGWMGGRVPRPSGEEGGAGRGLEGRGARPGEGDEGDGEESEWDLKTATESRLALKSCEVGMMASNKESATSVPSESNVGALSLLIIGSCFGSSFTPEDEDEDDEDGEDGEGEEGGDKGEEKSKGCSGEVTSSLEKMEKEGGRARMVSRRTRVSSPFRSEAKSLGVARMGASVTLPTKLFSGVLSGLESSLLVPLSVRGLSKLLDPGEELESPPPSSNEEEEKVSEFRLLSVPRDSFLPILSHTYADPSSSIVPFCVSADVFCGSFCVLWRVLWGCAAVAIRL